MGVVEEGIRKGWESEVKGAGREIEKGIGRRSKRRLGKVGER